MNAAIIATRSARPINAIKADVLCISIAPLDFAVDVVLLSLGHSNSEVSEIRIHVKFSFTTNKGFCNVKTTTHQLVALRLV